MTRPRERGNTGLWAWISGRAHRDGTPAPSAARAAVPRPLRSGQQTDPKPPRPPSLNSVLLTHTAPPPLRPRRSHDPAAGEEYWRFPRGWAASGKGALPFTLSLEFARPQNPSGARGGCGRRLQRKPFSRAVRTDLSPAHPSPPKLSSSSGVGTRAAMSLLVSSETAPSLRGNILCLI